MNNPPDTEGFTRLNLLGRGGTAEVYHVYSEKYHRYLALKVPRADNPETYSSFVRLLQREKHLIGDLSFPGLVRIIEASASGKPYLLLEL
ncbi:MAG: hypothetical protein AB1744_08870, partial [Candidatus Zixiibacteriota bacterium]